MKRISFTLLLFAFSVAIYCETINNDWVQRDVNCLSSILNLIKSGNVSVSTVEKLSNIDIRDTVDIGFNAKRIEIAQYGGYYTFWINICNYQNQICIMKIEIYDRNDEVLQYVLADKRIDKNYFLSNFKYINDDKDVSKKHYLFYYQNSNIYDDYIRNVQSKLGEMDSSSEDESFLELNDPIGSFDYGRICYYAAEKPIGRIAIDKLVSEKRYDLIKNVIKGYNAEGRVYALEALVTLSRSGMIELTHDDKLVMGIVLNLDIPISICGGCIVWKDKASTIFKSVSVDQIIIE